MANSTWPIILQTSLIYYIVPVFGGLLSFIHVCWVYSLYSFEYTWTHQSWSIPARIQFFEERWAYFFGFGLPCALITFWSPHFIGSGIFALLFPVYIIMANIATPLPIVSEKQRYVTIMDVVFASMASRVSTVSDQRRGNGSDEVSRVLHPLCPQRIPVFWASRKLSGAVLGVLGKYTKRK